MSKSEKRRRGPSTPGRPPLPREVRQRNRLTVTLTDSEFDALEDLAAEKDLHLGTVAREFIVRALKRRT